MSTIKNWFLSSISPRKQTPYPPTVVVGDETELNSRVTIPCPPREQDIEDSSPTEPMGRLEMSVLAGVCGARCGLAVAVAMVVSLALGGCANQVENAPVDSSHVATYVTVATFTGSQALMAQTCEQKRAGHVLGGHCAVTEGGRVNFSALYRGDGWTCVADIDQGARVQMTLTLKCEKPTVSNEGVSPDALPVNEKRGEHENHIRTHAGTCA